MLNFYFILASLAIVLPITYGFISDYKRDKKLVVIIALVVIILVTQYFISDYIKYLLSIFHV